MSTAEAELIAPCACAADVAFCRRSAADLPMNVAFFNYAQAIVIHDNLGAKAIAENGNFKGRSKHSDLRRRFLHYYIDSDIVKIKEIKRDLQLADIGTAPRPPPQLHTLWEVSYMANANCMLSLPVVALLFDYCSF